MTIKTALNRLSLSIILEEDLEWIRSGHLEYTSKVSNITVGSEPHTLTRSVTKTSNTVDHYYFDSIVQNRQGHVVLTHEIKINLPHTDKPISEVLPYERKVDFIALNEDGRFNSNTHWLSNNPLENSIINAVESLTKQSGKGNVKSLK